MKIEQPSQFLIWWRCDVGVGDCCDHWNFSHETPLTLCEAPMLENSGWRETSLGFLRRSTSLNDMFLRNRYVLILWGSLDFGTVWWRMYIRWMSDPQRSVEPVWRKPTQSAGCLLSLRLTSQYQVSGCKFFNSRIESFRYLKYIYVFRTRRWGGGNCDRG